MPTVYKWSREVSNTGRIKITTGLAQKVGGGGIHKLQAAYATWEAITRSNLSVSITLSKKMHIITSGLKKKK